MKKKTNQEQQLHISSFIKQPASLKLLILAGTNIKHTQLSIITKCTSLIKLDLSSNYLAELPMRFNNFEHMKILYLHNNQLSHVDIKGTNLQYISLFKNTIQPQEYRRGLIENNKQLLGIDFNIVTNRQKYGKPQVTLPIYSQIKWPIVEISSNLEHEDDYLNLLKAEIFVISNIYKRTIKIQTIERVMQGVVESKRYKNTRLSTNTGLQFLPSVLKAVSKWKKYIILKRKLRAILSKKNKQHLLDSNLQINRNRRSKGVDEVMQTFLPMVRMKMKVRDVMERQSRAYRAFLPAKKQLQANYLGYSKDRDYIKNPAKLYFRYSQTDILSKVCLYAKKLFFKQKDYDICDQFNNLFKQTNKKYYIFRHNAYLQNQWCSLLNSIHQTTRYVVGQVGVDRRHFLYTKKGHKKIGLKRVNKLTKVENLEQRMISSSKKIDYLYQKYDRLIEYQVSNWKILKTILKIIRYINAGNSSSIVSTQTAYFQTEVILDNQQPQSSSKRVKMHIGYEFFIKRVIAANIIQKSWRKFITKKKNINIIETLRKRRAQGLISKWIRNIIFEHRMTNLKTRSYYESVWREKQVYFHLDVYIDMPEPTNLLRFPSKPENKNNFYNQFHKGTQVQIVQTNGRRWIKIQFPNAKEAVRIHNLLQKYTYRYLNCFCLKLFTASQINDTKFLVKYEKQLSHLFHINVKVINKSDQQVHTKTTLWIDNPEPYFVWSQINALQHSGKFEKQQKKSTNVSIFIYNKHKRPLKVSCELYWVQQESLYRDKKFRYQVQKNDSKINSFPILNSSLKNTKLLKQQNKNKEDSQQFSILQLQMGLKSSIKKGKGRHMLDYNNQKLDKSHDKLNRRSSLGSSKNTSLNKSHRTRIVSDHRLQHLAETLNIRGK